MSIRYRRNINCLSSEQLHDLREAYQGLYDMPEAAADSFATLGGIHGLPLPMWCDHGSPGFLTWHRAYMKAFEKALQSVKCDVMLPFWNWSSGPTTGVPAACAAPTYVNRAGDTVPNPLYSGPIATAAGGGATSRRADIDTTMFGDIATTAQAAMSSTTFASFQSALNGPHGVLHARTGGEMGSVPLAGFDPILFLHHCNVDRLWWNLQQSHPGSALPASEATYELDPFPKPFSNQWQVGADVESTDDLGYRYRNWCFRLPPIIVWQFTTLKIDLRALRQLRDARLVIRSSRMPKNSVEFRLFIGDEEAVRSDAIERNPAFAGSIGAFGMGDLPMEHNSAPTGQRFDLEVNLTDHLRRCRGDHDHTERAEDVENEDVDLALRLVALGVNGGPVRQENLEIDEVELIID